MNKQIFGSLVVCIFFVSMFVVVSPAFACKDGDCNGVRVEDKVNIGNPVSEQGHNLNGWGPAGSVLGTDFRSTYSPFTGDKGKSASLDSNVPSFTCIDTIEVESKINIFKIVINDVEQQGQGMGSPQQVIPKGEYSDTFGRTVIFTEREVTIRGFKLIAHNELATPMELQIRVFTVPFKVFVNDVLVLTNANYGIGFSTYSVDLPASLNGQTTLTVRVQATGIFGFNIFTLVDWVQVDYCEGCTVQTD